MITTTKENCIYRLRVNLLETGVWREILVPSNLTAAKLHEIVQIAMGWKQAHMHELTRADTKVPDETLLAGIFSKIGSKLLYRYDFGDCWDHEIVLKEQIPSADGVANAPQCTDGKLACPPEDCGGISRYHQLVELKGTTRALSYEEK